MKTRILIAASAVVLLVGCGQDTLDVSMQGQDEGGTPLALGFTTPPGTVLQGPVFEQPSADVDGFIAIMTLTGDPVGAYDAFAAQAAQMGYQLKSARETCIFSGNNDLLYTPDDDAHGWTERPDNAELLTCSTDGQIQDGEQIDETGFMRLTVSQGQQQGEVQSTAVLDVQQSGAAPDVAARPAPEPGVRGLGRPTSWEPPERFGLEFEGASLAVVDGSALAGPTGALPTCAGGYYAVLRVTEDLEAITDAYQEQIQARGWEPGSETAANRAGVRAFEQAGGGFFTLTPIQDESAAWLLITRCND